MLRHPEGRTAGPDLWPGSGTGSVARSQAAPRRTLRCRVTCTRAVMNIPRVWSCAPSKEEPFRILFHPSVKVDGVKEEEGSSLLLPPPRSVRTSVVVAPPTCAGPPPSGSVAFMCRGNDRGTSGVTMATPILKQVHNDCCSEFWFYCC